MGNTQVSELDATIAALRRERDEELEFVEGLARINTVALELGIDRGFLTEPVQDAANRLLQINNKLAALCEQPVGENHDR